MLFPPFHLRLKAGLKLQDEAEKKEVEKSIHLLQDPEGTPHVQPQLLPGVIYIETCCSSHTAATKKVEEAQRQRMAAKAKPKAMEMETE